MKNVIAGAAAALILVTGLGAAPSAADAAVPKQLSGVWRNPKNTVHVRIQPCDGEVCGTVVWASDKARKKAAEAGTPKLVGTQLFKSFSQKSANSWGGRVFVPDMGRTFSGTLKAASPNAVVAKGCVLGGLICKSQAWKRVA